MAVDFSPDPNAFAVSSEASEGAGDVGDTQIASRRSVVIRVAVDIAIGRGWNELRGIRQSP